MVLIRFILSFISISYSCFLPMAKAADSFLFIATHIVGVFRGVWMPFGAMRFACVFGSYTNPPQNIFASAYNLHMKRINAISVAAEMVYSHILGYLAKVIFIYKAMGKYASVMGSKLTITTPLRSKPIPAGLRFVNFRPKADYWSSSFWSSHTSNISIPTIKMSTGRIVN